MNLSRRRFLQALAAVPVVAGITQIRLPEWVVGPETQPAKYSNILNVADTHFLMAGDIIKVDDELMYITSVSSDALTVVRGFGPSQAAGHRVDARVEYMAMARRESEYGG